MRLMRRFGFEMKRLAITLSCELEVQGIFDLQVAVALGCIPTPLLFKDDTKSNENSTGESRGIRRILGLPD